VNNSIPVVPGENSDETGSLALELASAYKKMAAFYRDQLELLGPDADARVRGTDYSAEEQAADRQRIFDWPAAEISWFDLTRLAESNPDDAGAAWVRVRTEAGASLRAVTAPPRRWSGMVAPGSGPGFSPFATASGSPHRLRPASSRPSPIRPPKPSGTTWSCRSTCTCR